MKVIVKIIILVIAITLAIGGVMIYAKTKVDPPVAKIHIKVGTGHLIHFKSAPGLSNTFILQIIEELYFFLLTLCF